MSHAHDWHHLIHPVTGDPYRVCPCGAEELVHPAPPPATDDRCWPFPCRDYHDTYEHRTGEDPCACPCHKEQA